MPELSGVGVERLALPKPGLAQTALGEGQFAAKPGDAGWS